MSVPRFFYLLPDQCEYRACDKPPVAMMADPFSEFPIETIRFYCAHHAGILMAQSKPDGSTP